MATFYPCTNPGCNNKQHRTSNCPNEGFYRSQANRDLLAQIRELGMNATPVTGQVAAALAVRDDQIAAAERGPGTIDDPTYVGDPTTMEQDEVFQIEVDYHSDDIDADLPASLDGKRMDGAVVNYAGPGGGNPVVRVRGTREDIKDWLDEYNDGDEESTSFMMEEYMQRAR